MNILDSIEKEQMKTLPEFSIGDTLKVSLKVKEGDKERIQVFEGVCIAKSGGGVRETFTVRKVSYGEGVERTIPMHSPLIGKIEIAKRGKVARAKLFYLRELTGKATRIKEKEYKPEKAAAAAGKAPRKKAPKK
ncbi:MAG TPA: 50S ribosomal protein L19 [Nitrospirota bacterium]|nr:50S ribosomal protein L19 [Nitrospirota bacterium]